MSRALQVLREERSLLQKQLNALDAAISALSGGQETHEKRNSGKRTMSEATKEKLRKAAKARWAKIKK
jgi:hypothetical protein